jgi:hypothetical protein
MEIFVVLRLSPTGHPFGYAIAFCMYGRHWYENIFNGNANSSAFRIEGERKMQKGLPLSSYALTKTFLTFTLLFVGFE